MKKYEQPSMSILFFKIEDVITSSTADVDGGNTNFPSSWLTINIDGTSTNFLSSWLQS